jgi:hypothetical protein
MKDWGEFRPKKNPGLSANPGFPDLDPEIKRQRTYFKAKPSARQNSPNPQEHLICRIGRQVFWLSDQSGRNSFPA